MTARLIGLIAALALLAGIVAAQNQNNQNDQNGGGGNPYVVGEWFLGDVSSDTPSVTTADTQFIFLHPIGTSSLMNMPSMIRTGSSVAATGM